MMDPDMRQALLDVIEHMDTLTTKVVGVEREIVALRKHMNHEIAVLMDETASKEDLQDLKEYIDHELESLRADMVEKRLSLAGAPLGERSATKSFWACPGGLWNPESRSPQVP